MQTLPLKLRAVRFVSLLVIAFTIQFSAYCIAMISFATFLAPGADAKLGGTVVLVETVVSANLSDTMEVLLNRRGIVSGVMTMQVGKALRYLPPLPFHAGVNCVAFLLFGALAGHVGLLSLAGLYPLLLFGVTLGFLGSSLLPYHASSGSGILVILVTQLVATFMGATWSRWLRGY